MPHFQWTTPRQSLSSAGKPISEHSKPSLADDFGWRDLTFSKIHWNRTTVGPVLPDLLSSFPSRNETGVGWFMKPPKTFLIYSTSVSRIGPLHAICFLECLVYHAGWGGMLKVFPAVMCCRGSNSSLYSYSTIGLLSLMVLLGSCGLSVNLFFQLYDW